MHSGLNAKYYPGENKPVVEIPIYAIDAEDKKRLEDANAIVSVERLSTPAKMNIALYIEMNGEEHMVLSDSRVQDGSRAAIKECLALFKGDTNA